MANTSETVTDLSCNETELNRDHIAIWCSTGIVGRI